MVAEQGHVGFRVSERVLPGVVGPLQNTPAKQGQFLHPDAILANQQQVRPDFVLGSLTVFRYAFECEHAETGIVTKSSKNVSHPLFPFESILLTRLPKAITDNPPTAGYR
jgi:hypothetical protein